MITELCIFLAGNQSLQTALFLEQIGYLVKLTTLYKLSCKNELTK